MPSEWKWSKAGSLGKWPREAAEWIRDWPQTFHNSVDKDVGGSIIKRLVLVGLDPGKLSSLQPEALKAAVSEQSNVLRTTFDVRNANLVVDQTVASKLYCQQFAKVIRGTAAELVGELKDRDDVDPLGLRAELGLWDAEWREHYGGVWYSTFGNKPKSPSALYIEEHTKHYDQLVDVCTQGVLAANHEFDGPLPGAFSTSNIYGIPIRGDLVVSVSGHTLLFLLLVGAAVVAGVIYTIIKLLLSVDKLSNDVGKLSDDNRKLSNANRKLSQSFDLGATPVRATAGSASVSKRRPRTRVE